MATANSLINGAADLVGIKAQGETLSAADAQDLLRRLNNMVSGWRAQSLTVLATTRHVFNLTANQQQYSIGSGGDFNVPRPQSVSGAALLLDGLTSAQSVTITRSSTTATVTLASHGFSVGQEVLIAGATQTAYNGLQIIQSVAANSFTFDVFGSPVTPATGSPTVQAYDGDPVEIPRTLITDDAYQAIQLKTMSNAQFTNVYYNPTQPLGTIWLWPMPSTAENQLVLYLQNTFTSFADLTTDYAFVDVPGYADALEYNLAIRACAPFGRRIGDFPEVIELARDTLGLIKRQNYRLSDLPTDPALTASRIGGYNIQTGNM